MVLSWASLVTSWIFFSVSFGLHPLARAAASARYGALPAEVSLKLSQIGKKMKNELAGGATSIYLLLQTFKRRAVPDR